MKRIREAILDVFLIGRLTVHPQDFGQLDSGASMATKIQRAKQCGKEFAERILREEVNRDINHYNGQPIFQAWESLNEVFPENTDLDTQKLFEDYQVAFGTKMLAAGFEPIAFNFSQGNGRGQQWLDIYPGTLETYKYLGFHEYDWPTMDRLHQIGLDGPDEPHNRIPGVGEGYGNDGMWRCLRYRRIMNEGIRQRYGDRHVCIITECGMTQGVWGGSSLDIGPWATELTVPANIPGGVASTPIPVDNYWQSLRWYNSEIMKDDYLMGACLFVTGAAGKPEWETFEHLGPIMDRLATFQQEVSLEPLASTPPPPEIPSVRIQPAVATSSRPAASLASLSTSTTSTPPTADPARLSTSTGEPPPAQPEAPAPTQTPAGRWSYTMEPGQGLPLLVGDIGLADEPITITKPDGRVEQLTSGSKPEFGIGGFEIYANRAGTYRIQFLGETFDLSLTGQFTKVTFSQEG